MFLGNKRGLYFEDSDLNSFVEENMGNLASMNPCTQSLFVPERAINTHPRFKGLAQSIRERRGEKVNITVPLFKDENTDMQSVSAEEPYPGQIYMDAMPFGMGQCCLQLTYECSTINHAKYLYDQLNAFTGIFAALSASGPVQKGKLSDNDIRWTVIEQSVDCRTADERNPDSPNYVPKSRYSSINHYLSDHEFVTKNVQDSIPIKYSQESFDFLKEQCPELSDKLAVHVAALFSRDPVPMYEGELIDDQIDDNTMTMHFENLQSTNWNSLRFKPPPNQSSKVGWRVEFRTLDI